MKKIISLLLCILLIPACFVTPAHAEDKEPDTLFDTFCDYLREKCGEDYVNSNEISQPKVFGELNDSTLFFWGGGTLPCMICTVQIENYIVTASYIYHPYNLGLYAFCDGQIFTLEQAIKSNLFTIEQASKICSSIKPLDLPTNVPVHEAYGKGILTMPFSSEVYCLNTVTGTYYDVYGKAVDLQKFRHHNGTEKISFDGKEYTIDHDKQLAYNSDGSVDETVSALVKRVYDKVASLAMGCVFPFEITFAGTFEQSGNYIEGPSSEHIIPALSAEIYVFDKLYTTTMVTHEAYDKDNAFSSLFKTGENYADGIYAEPFIIPSEFIISDKIVPFFCSFGDVTMDNVANMQDVVSIQKHIAGFEGFKAVNCLAADMNCDGEVNLLDVVTLQRKIVGL